MHKVTRHVLDARRARRSRRRDEDFLVSDNLDFHPTDVLEDADGSLLVIDTGGWYKLCCPTSQLRKPDVLGGDLPRAAARRRRTVDDPRGLQACLGRRCRRTELAGLLDDPRPAVRRRAIEALAERGGERPSPALAAVSSRVDIGRGAAERRLGGDCGSTHPDARAVVRLALRRRGRDRPPGGDPLGELWRDREAVPRLLSCCRRHRPQNRRAAAEALGRIGDKSAVPALLTAVGRPIRLDRMLEHSLTYALIEIGDPTATGRRPDERRRRDVRRAALIALDQMDGGGLEPRVGRRGCLTAATRPARGRRRGSSAGTPSGAARWPASSAIG